MFADYALVILFSELFGLFGFFYMGVAQYGFYVKLMAERWFPNAAAFAAKPFREKLRDPRGIRDLFAQVSIDQFIHVPLVFYPCYYLTKEWILGDPDNDMEQLMLNSYQKWTTNLFDDAKVNLSSPHHGIAIQ